MSHAPGREETVAEALALHDRYQQDVVERLGICPWARKARFEGRTRTHVILDPSAEASVLDAVLEAWVADGTVEVGFVILPRFRDGFSALERWGDALSERTASAFFAAAFHPDAPADAGPVRFFRQSPHPTVQLVRRTRLEEVRAQDPCHYADIFTLTLEDLRGSGPRKTAAAAVLDHNRRLLEQQGRDELLALFPRAPGTPEPKP
ncbi:MAG: DUF1415 family protein [Myxococcota bacterium]